jgi:16S rRNA (guanine966-N2)-methyltransferase
MRIVGGTLRGRTLDAPATAATRPTSDRVRESIFNILAHGIQDFTIEGARVLDLFAGSGALGFEALSRGAKFCQFVEEGAPARGTIRTNADRLGVIGLCKIWRRDAADLGSCAPQSPFDLVFCDPPYGKNLGVAALNSVMAGGWLKASGIAVLEESARINIVPPDNMVSIDTRTYGDTAVHLFRAP